MTSFVMTDQIRAGQTLADTDGIELSDSELKTMLRIFKKLRAPMNAVKQEYILRKNSDRNTDPDKKKHTLSLFLRKHKRDATWFFNVEGNPVAHFKGHNYFGSAQAGRVIKVTYKRVLEWLSKESGIAVPQSMYEAAEKGRINIHLVEFAAYTTKINADIQRLINAWRFMYRHSSYKERPDGLHIFLDEMLQVSSTVHKKDYPSSFALATVEKDLKTRKVSICMYQKDVEIEERGLVIADDVLETIEDRLRVDIEFSKRWLESKRVQTVADLERLIEAKHSGSWVSFVQSEFGKVVAQSCLIYMWTFPNIFVKGELEQIPRQWLRGQVDEEVEEWMEIKGVDKRVSFEAHVAMVFARAQYSITGMQKMEALYSESTAEALGAKLFALASAVDKSLRKAARTLAIDTGDFDED